MLEQHQIETGHLGPSPWTPRMNPWSWRHLNLHFWGTRGVPGFRVPNTFSLATDQLRDAIMQWYLQMDFSWGLGFWGRLGPSTLAVDGTCNPGIGIFGNISSACRGASTHDSEGMLAT